MATDKHIQAEIPLLRGRREYFTNTKTIPKALHSHEVSYSLAPSIIVNQSLQDARTIGYENISKITIDQLIDIYSEASKLFISDKPVGIEHPLSLSDTYTLMTATTGMPILYIMNAFVSFARHCIDNLKSILLTLSPDNSLSVYDDYEAHRGDLMYAWVRRGKNLGVVAPSNHPGVNSMWTIMSAMKCPTLVRPSTQEGLFSYRIIQSLYEAGIPENFLYYLPMDHQMTNEFLNNADLGVVFGSEQTVAMYEGKERIKTYGPGRSKLVLDTNYIESKGLSDILDSIINSVIYDTHRGCINASSLLVVGQDSPKVATELADIIANRFTKIEPEDVFSPQATLGAFVEDKMASGINSVIERTLNEDSVDLVKQYRGTDRYQIVDDAHFLLPTVIHCKNKWDPGLFGVEFPFPFLTILAVDDFDEAIKFIDRSLVVTLFSNSLDYAKKLLEMPHVEKVYLGEELTCAIDSAEPHEGFASDFIFRSKAFRRPKTSVDKESSIQQFLTYISQSERATSPSVINQSQYNENNTNPINLPSTEPMIQESFSISKILDVLEQVPSIPANSVAASPKSNLAKEFEEATSTDHPNQETLEAIYKRTTEEKALCQLENTVPPPDSQIKSVIAENEPEKHPLANPDLKNIEISFQKQIKASLNAAKQLNATPITSDLAKDNKLPSTEIHTALLSQLIPKRSENSVAAPSEKPLDALTPIVPSKSSTQLESENKVVPVQIFTAESFSADSFVADTFSAKSMSAASLSAKKIKAKNISGENFKASSFIAESFSTKSPVTAEAIETVSVAIKALNAEVFTAQSFSAEAFSAKSFSASNFVAQPMKTAESKKEKTQPLSPAILAPVDQPPTTMEPKTESKPDNITLVHQRMLHLFQNLAQSDLTYKIFSLLCENEELTIVQLMKETGLSMEVLRINLKNIARAGIITFENDIAKLILPPENK